MVIIARWRLEAEHSRFSLMQLHNAIASESTSSHYLKACASCLQSGVFQPAYEDPVTHACADGGDVERRAGAAALPAGGNVFWVAAAGRAACPPRARHLAAGKRSVCCASNS